MDGAANTCMAVQASRENQHKKYGDENMYQIWAMYFSATGTTKKVVTRIADTLAAGEAKQYDFTLPGARSEKVSFTESDVVVFGVPVYAGRVPNVLLKFLNSVEGNGARAIPVVVYGNRNYDDALIELAGILDGHGFLPVAAGAFIGEHSFSYKLGAGRPDDKDLAAAAEFAEHIDLNREKPIKVKGNDPLSGYYQPRDRHGNPINILKVKPLTSDACINCGLCARVCPMGSISPEDVRTFTGICIKCGACVKKCPKGAKYYDHAGYEYHKTELAAMYERRAEPEIFL